MPVGYHPLTPAERCPIHARLYRGVSKREMARDLGRDPATISREASRHRGQRGDRHQQADGQATACRQAASAVPRKRTPEHWAEVEDRRRAGGSPEPIAGRYRQQGEVMAGKEWIYQQVRVDRQAGGTRYRYLRRRGQTPNGRGGRHAGRGHIPDRVDLVERPSVVAEKSRIGDWEREPILGARPRGARVSAVDRGSKFTVLEWVEGKTAAAGHRGAPPASGADPGPGPHRHGRSRQGVREASGDRTEARCGLLLCHPLPFLGTGPERAHQRPGAPVLPERDRLPPGDCRAGAGGRGPTPPSASEGPGIPHPGGGLCPWVGSPRTRPAVPRSPSWQSGDPPERPRSASRCRFRPGFGRWLRSGSPAVEMVAIRGRKEALDARIFGSPPRSLPSGYALIPGSRRLLHFGVEAGNVSPFRNL